MFLPFSIHEMLPWLKLISLRPEHIKSDCSSTFSSWGSLIFFLFFFSKYESIKKKNVFLICVALYPWRAETLPFMHYRPVCATHGFWAVLVWKGVYIDSEFKRVWVFKETMRAHKLIWLFTSEWKRKFSSNTTIWKKQLEKYVDLY